MDYFYELGERAVASTPLEANLSELADLAREQTQIAIGLRISALMTEAENAEFDELLASGCDDAAGSAFLTRTVPGHGAIAREEMALLYAKLDAMVAPYRSGRVGGLDG